MGEIALEWSVLHVGLWCCGAFTRTRSYVFANLQHCVSEEDDKPKKLQESELPFWKDWWMQWRDNALPPCWHPRDPKFCYQSHGTMKVINFASLWCHEEKENGDCWEVEEVWTGIIPSFRTTVRTKCPHPPQQHTKSLKWKGSDVSSWSAWSLHLFH
jgi:hypothetical protein